MGWIADFINDIVFPFLGLAFVFFIVYSAAREVPSFLLKAETENCALTGKAINRETKYEFRVGCLVKTSKNEWVLLSTYRTVE